VFWVDRVTIRCHMGCLPYFAATGTHPILLLDIAKATYLLLPPDMVLSTTDLITRRVIALQKHKSHLSTLHSQVMTVQLQAAIRFEHDHVVTMRNFYFKAGDLMLVRNTAIEKALNRKMRPHYISPLVVISRNKGGVYIICELNGSVFDRPVAAFHVVPYFARKSISLPNLDNFLDIPTMRLHEMESSEEPDPDADVVLKERSGASDSDDHSERNPDDMSDDN